MKKLKNGYRKAVFIWTDMVFGVFVYALIVEIMRRDSAFFENSFPPQEGDMLKYLVLIGFAIMTFLVIKSTQTQILSAKSSGDSPGEKTSLSSTVSKIMRASLITQSLCEAIAIYGLILFFFTKNPFDFYIFMLISLIYFTFNFPRYAQWEEWIAENK